MHKQQFGMEWNPTPMGARIALAMSRVMMPLDPEIATELAWHAEAMAFEVGMYSHADAIPSPLLSAEPDLVEAFNSGQTHPLHSRYDEPEPWSCAEERIF